MVGELRERKRRGKRKGRRRRERKEEGSSKGRQARGMKRKRKFLDLEETESLVPGNLEGLLSGVLILLLAVALRKGY